MPLRWTDGQDIIRSWFWHSLIDVLLLSQHLLSILFSVFYRLDLRQLTLTAQCHPQSQLVSTMVAFVSIHIGASMAEVVKISVWTLACHGFRFEPPHGRILLCVKAFQLPYGMSGVSLHHESKTLVVECDIIPKSKFYRLIYHVKEAWSTRSRVCDTWSGSPGFSSFIFLFCLYKKPRKQSSILIIMSCWDMRYNQYYTKLDQNWISFPFTWIFKVERFIQQTWWPKGTYRLSFIHSWTLLETTGLSSDSGG